MAGRSFALDCAQAASRRSRVNAQRPSRTRAPVVAGVTVAPGRRAQGHAATVRLVLVRVGPDSRFGVSKVGK